MGVGGREEGLLGHLGGVAYHVVVPVKVVADGEGGAVQLVQAAVEEGRTGVLLTAPPQNSKEQGGQGGCVWVSGHHRKEAEPRRLEAGVTGVAEGGGGIEGDLSHVGA